MPSGEPQVLVQGDERGVVTIVLNRPEARNAFSAELVDQLIASVARVSEDPTTRVLVLSGSGPSFSAGGDIDAMERMATYTLEENLEDSTKMNTLFRSLDTCSCPVVVEVHGAARGGGVGLVACADIAVATPEATFAFSEVRLGIIPAVVSTYVIPKIGWSWSRRLLTTGETIDARTAERIGLVHEVVEDDAIGERIDRVVDQVLAGRPRAQRNIKTLLAEQLNDVMSREAAMRTAITAASHARMSDEGHEGLAQFLRGRGKGGGTR